MGVFRKSHELRKYEVRSTKWVRKFGDSKFIIDDMLGVGILGLGEGRSTISAVLQSEKLQLKMICDANLALCRQRADEFKVYEYTTSYEEMLQDEGIDIIAIYTPDHLHAEHVPMALQQGKHVV